MAVLRVNEVAVNLYSPREAANWWALYRAHGPAERFTTVTAAIPGDLVDVACEDIDDAEWLRDLLIERGIPRTALKILNS
jgi:hypothetical protein